jgi:hypothetical protein
MGVRFFMSVNFTQLSGLINQLRERICVLIDMRGRVRAFCQ